MPAVGRRSDEGRSVGVGEVSGAFERVKYYDVEREVAVHECCCCCCCCTRASRRARPISAARAASSWLDVRLASSLADCWLLLLLLLSLLSLSLLLLLLFGFRAFQRGRQTRCRAPTVSPSSARPPLASAQPEAGPLARTTFLRCAALARGRFGWAICGGESRGGRESATNGTPAACLKLLRRRQRRRQRRRWRQKQHSMGSSRLELPLVGQRSSGWQLAASPSCGGGQSESAGRADERRAVSSTTSSG